VRRVVLVASVVVAVVLLVVSFFWALQRRLIYLPSTGAVPSAATMLPGARQVQLTTRDGLQLGAWYLPARDSADTFTVLVANGNAGNRSLRVPLAQALANQGFGVLLFDYRGYGGNPGSPSEEGLARDVRAAHRFLTEEGVPGERLLYYGESLGAAVVAELATEHPPAGLVLRSPFTDLASVGQLHYPFLPVRALLKDRFPAAEYLARVTVPITVVYGAEDSIVPPDESTRSVVGARGSTRLVAVPGADHNDPALLNGNVLVQAIVELANEINRNPQR
jgi:pimeloyl-ACP methyl ester carboxylesterase